MKKISIMITSSLAWIISIVPASAQMINLETTSNFADEVGQSAGFSDVSLGYVIAMLIKGSLSVLGLIFIILMILAGFRWMNSGGNEETIKKAQQTIKNSLIGLIIVLAAWSITYFVFNVLPFSAPSTGGIVTG